MTELVDDNVDMSQNVVSSSSVHDDSSLPDIQMKSPEEQRMEISQNCIAAGPSAVQCESTADSDVVADDSITHDAGTCVSSAPATSNLADIPRNVVSEVCMVHEEPLIAGSQVSTAVTEEETDALTTHMTAKRVRRLKELGKYCCGNAGAADVDDDDDDIEDDDLLQKDPMMGHTFNEHGQLRDRDGKPFEFDVYKNQRRNQKRYEHLGEAVTELVYKLLENECNLKRILLPVELCDRGSDDNQPHSFIFATDNWSTTTDRLLVLIHGSGVVRAGQWARRLILNEDLEKGTQLPYIKRAVAEGYEVLILNTNLNRWPDVANDNRQPAVPIPDNDSPEAHASYVWRTLISRQAKAQHIAIVAHSYGGVVTTHLAVENSKEFIERVFAVAFTDSVHSLMYYADGVDMQVTDFFVKHARNWVSSNLPRDERLPSFHDDCCNDAPRVSAGHEKHEWTSYASFDSVFTFLHDKYTTRVQVKSQDMAPVESESCDTASKDVESQDTTHAEANT